MFKVSWFFTSSEAMWKEVLVLKGAVFAAVSALVTFTSPQGGGNLLPSSLLDVTGDVALYVPVETAAGYGVLTNVVAELVVWSQCCSCRIGVQQLG